MLTKSILREEIQPFSYYDSLIPMYLKQSYGFEDMIKMWYDICFAKREEDSSSITSTIDDLFNCFNIYEFSTEIDYRSYIQFISELIDAAADNFSLLDMLADFFGVSRYLSVEVEGEQHDLVLTNAELVTFIKSQIIRNNFDGTLGQFNLFYKSIGLPVIGLFDDNESGGGNEAICHVYMLLADTDQISENIQLLFLAGLLSVESLGIRYTYNISSASNIAIFDSTDVNRVFDAGKFI